MHCCQTALEIDLEKHSVIYLTSVLTIWSIDLPKLNVHLREALVCDLFDTLTSELGSCSPSPACPVLLSVSLWTVLAVSIIVAGISCSMIRTEIKLGGE